MEHKHKSIDDFRRKNELYRMHQIKNQQDLHKSREDDVVKYMKKKEDMHKRRVNDIEVRQGSIEKMRIRKETDMRRTMQERAMKNLKKEEFVNRQKSQFEIFKEEYDTKIKDRLNKINERIMTNKEKTYKEMINKYDNMQIRREDNLEKYLSNEKANEYEREKRMELIVARMKRIEEMK